MDASGIITMGLEKIDQCRAEISSLSESHGDEFTYHKDDKGPTDPDWDLALKMEEKGIFQIAALRIDGRLVGYFMFTFMFFPFYKTVSICRENTFYVLPQYRKTTGYRFVRFSVEKMKETGARFISVSNKIKADYGPIWERLGFEPEEITYTMKVRD